MCKRLDCSCEWYENRKDRHHLTPQSLGGTDKPTLRIWRARHNAWHRLFGLLTLDQVIDLLETRCSNTYWIVNRAHSHHVGDSDWLILFGNKTLDEALALLRRLRRYKY